MSLLSLASSIYSCMRQAIPFPLAQPRNHVKGRFCMDFTGLGGVKGLCCPSESCSINECVSVTGGA